MLYGIQIGQWLIQMVNTNWELTKNLLNRQTKTPEKETLYTHKVFSYIFCILNICILKKESMTKRIFELDVIVIISNLKKGIVVFQRRKEMAA